jgi:uncharacterized membrane protein YhhN
MTQPLQKKIALVFWVIAVINMIGIAAGIALLQYATKPLLLPTLIVLLSSATGAEAGKKIMLIALFFSWLGDVLLLFESRDPLFFIFGLVCFLTTHILYIIYFLNIRSENSSLLKRYPLLIIPVLAYGISLVWLLFPHLADLKIPVMVYAAVICAMLLCSLHVFYKVARPANILYITGALFFVCSDSLLAVNKFYQPFAYAGVFIILTYCLAQFLIVLGFIELKK